MSGDPFVVLGLPRSASVDEVRARYVELVKQHPPDRDPEMFERVRDAYRAASDPLHAARWKLFGPPPLRDLDELVELLRRRGRPALGAEAWLAVLRERR